MEELKNSDILNVAGAGYGHSLLNQHSSQLLDDDKDDKNNKRKYLKKKHWHISLLVQFPGIEETLKVNA